MCKEKYACRDPFTVQMRQLWGISTNPHVIRCAEASLAAMKLQTQAGVKSCRPNLLGVLRNIRFGSRFTERVRGLVDRYCCHLGCCLLWLYNILELEPLLLLFWVCCCSCCIGCRRFSYPHLTYSVGIISSGWWNSSLECMMWSTFSSCTFTPSITCSTILTKKLFFEAILH